MQTLVVINPFGGHDKGHRITDPQEIDAVLASEHSHSVVRANHDSVPAALPVTTITEE